MNKMEEIATGTLRLRSGKALTFDQTHSLPVALSISGLSFSIGMGVKLMVYGLTSMPSERVRQLVLAGECLSLVVAVKSVHDTLPIFFSLFPAFRL